MTRSQDSGDKHRSFLLTFLLSQEQRPEQSWGNNSPLVPQDLNYWLKNNATDHFLSWVHDLTRTRKDAGNRGVSCWLSGPQEAVK
jgi:hypothetical protein